MPLSILEFCTRLSFGKPIDPLSAPKADPIQMPVSTCCYAINCGSTGVILGRLKGSNSEADSHYVPRSGTEVDAHGLPGLGQITGGIPVGGGMHGGLNRHEINTVLILGDTARGGPPRVNEAPSGIIDIASTVLDLLGLDAPASMRGASLKAADTREVAAPIESFEAGIGSFRQRLSVRRRGNHQFPVHGSRIG